MIYHIDYIIVTNLSVGAGIIHGEADLIRYAAEISTEICELCEYYKHVYVMLIRFMYARMI